MIFVFSSCHCFHFNSHKYRMCVFIYKLLGSITKYNFIFVFCLKKLDSSFEMPAWFSNLCLSLYYVFALTFSGQGCEHVFVCMGLLCAWTFFFAAPFRDFHCDQIFRVARCLLYKAIIFYKSHFWNPTSYFVEVGF